MTTRFQKGDAVFDGLVMLAVVGIIVFLAVLPSSKTGPTKSMGGFGQSYTPTTENSSNPNAELSPTISTVYHGSLSLGSGSAQYAYEPYQEYVTLSNHGSHPVDISGWKLEDGRGQRTYNVGGNIQNFPSITASIPTANGQDIILKPGDYAYIVTGAIDNTNPYTVTSARENECTGYIANTPGYNFNPPVITQCVTPSYEPGVRALDNQCQRFIQTLPSCQTPKFDTVSYGSDYTSNSQGQTCVGCVNGTAGLSNQCIAFIKAHYSYPGCLANHASDPNFYSSTWRIFLNQPWEMWAADHDTISLFDLQGNLASYKSY